MNKLFQGLVLSAALFSLSAQALPLPKAPRALVQMPAGFTSNYNFEGIVELSNCSGSLIRLESSKDTDFAMILTNGHCNERGFPDPGQAFHNVSSSRRFGLLDPQGNSTGQVYASKLLYATMTQTDISLYKLTQTYAEIQQQFNIRPFTLSSTHSTAGLPIEVISGYWQRGYSCVIETFVNQMQEDGYSWTDSIRYSRPGCEVIGGTSGSPIIASGTRTVIGINNTGNEDGEKCTRNNPCEIDKNGNVTYQLGYTYGQETYWIYSCFNSQGGFDLSTPGCLLPH